MQSLFLPQVSQTGEIITSVEQSFPEFCKVDSRQWFGFAVLCIPESLQMREGNELAACHNTARVSSAPGATAERQNENSLEWGPWTQKPPTGRAPLACVSLEGLPFLQPGASCSIKGAPLSCSPEEESNCVTMGEKLVCSVQSCPGSSP